MRCDPEVARCNREPARCVRVNAFSDSAFACSAFAFVQSNRACARCVHVNKRSDPVLAIRCCIFALRLSIFAMCSRKMRTRTLSLRAVTEYLHAVFKQMRSRFDLFQLLVQFSDSRIVENLSTAKLCIFNLSARDILK